MVKRIKSIHLALAYLIFIVLVGLFADFLANEDAFTKIPSDKALDYQSILQPAFSDGVNHLLGTDKVGRDVLAGIIHGSRTSLGIALLSMTVAAILGILIGGLSGFYGDSEFRVSSASIITAALSIFVFWYNVIHLHFNIPGMCLGLVIIILFYGIMKATSICKTQLRLPLDFITLKFTEVYSSIPRYFLILAVIAFVVPSWTVFALIIGLTSWIRIARLTRGEMIKVRNSQFIDSARALGVSRTRLFFIHALPNALGPLPYEFTFGLAGIMVVESTLSFLGLGLPADVVSWGSLLADFKKFTSAWWLAVFPGATLFITILCLHSVGKWVDAWVNPKSIYSK
ncbi:MAG: ABC transporter permease [Cyclobacteriaceae bacterium]